VANLRGGHRAEAYRLHHIGEQDLGRAAELERTYASLDLGLVDAAVVVACERPRHCDSLRLLPE
jgi:hypothetical protein